MTRVPGVILAGGQATRMGCGDKGLLQLGDRKLIEHVIARIAPQVSELVLNANGDPDRFSEFGLPVISDGNSGFEGPLAGVLAGLDWAAEQGAETIVTVAADTPFFPTNLVTVMSDVRANAGTPLVLASTQGSVPGYNRHPTFGLWPVSLREDLRRSLQDGLRKVVAWTDKHGCASAEFPILDYDPFFNVNTPQDLERARLLLRKVSE
ncbi:MAG: molybdenum cofactor guanylyltransferase MobA [Marinosulfonomonas sp.]|nr:molybdenum cofactor guanylyltransferase MobA [Marinosulfonomonas sp.]